MKRKQVKNPNLHHYGTYLDETIANDKYLIDCLEPLAKSRRVGELVRHLLTQHFTGGIVSRIEPVKIVSAAMALHSEPVSIPQMPTEYSSTMSAKDKVRRAMFR